MDMGDLGELGKTIRRLRMARNITLTEFSDKTGIQPATLNRMENNKMIGTLDAYNALAEAFRLKLSEFFQECEKDQLESFEVTTQVSSSVETRFLGKIFYRRECKQQLFFWKKCVDDKGYLSSYLLRWN